MLIQQKSQFEFCADAVCSRNERRLLHVLEFLHGKCSRKTSEVRENFRAHCFSDMLFHEFYRLVTCLNIYTCTFIIHMSPFYLLHNAKVSPAKYGA